MKSIYTLVPDIQYLLTTKGWMTDQLAQEMTREIQQRLQPKFEEGEKEPTLRLSKMGPVCPKALWHSIHTPAEAEPLPSWAEFKFTFGHVIEALAIVLAKAAGHEVTGEQDVITVDGIVGHRDCVIDGCIVDVKSSSSLGMAKFKDGSIEQNDSFGYLDQLDGYLCGSMADPLVTVKDRSYLLVIDKTLGHIVLHEHMYRGDKYIHDRIASHKRIVALGEPPKCTCPTIKDGESGNIKLDFPANYSSFKYCCFPSVRTFLYSGGPRYLTKVVRQPYDNKTKRYITEVDRYGKTVYS